jgi:hypothetical protein
VGRREQKCLTKLHGSILGPRAVFAILPLLALWPVFLALPYLTRRGLRRLMIISTAVAITVSRLHDVFRISRSSLFRWLRAYEQGGINALVDQKIWHCGRPSKKE